MCDAALFFSRPHAQSGPVPLPPPLVVSPVAARRFARRALGLDAPSSNIASTLAHLGYVQIDPINVCGRMHDLILRNRVAEYREGDLMRFLHGENGTPLPPGGRQAFEQHAPDTGNLAAYPLEAWPHLLATMQARSKRTGAWSGRLTPRERELAPQLIAEIAARGPLGSEDFEDDRRAHRVVWGAASLVKSTLQKLFFHGRLLIAQRANNRRRYDLPERVLPAPVLAQPAASTADTKRWLALLKLRQRRLALLKREELRLIDDQVQPVKIDRCPPVFCLREDVALLMDASAMDDDRAQCPPEASTSAADRATPPPEFSTRICLLAPLDPLIYDRRLTAALWNFDYTWEAYTPPRKRVRGYYALPVLAGTEIVGHVDPKADRAQRRLTIVSRRVRSGHKVSSAVRELAGWLGLRRR